MKNRLARVNSVIQRELGAMIVRDISFGNSLVTVHSVDIAPNLRSCQVFVGVIGNDADKNRVVRKLQAHRAELQAGLAKRVVLKYTPHLHFNIDESVERGVRVVQLLEKIDETTPLDSEEPDAKS